MKYMTSEEITRNGVLSLVLFLLLGLIGVNADESLLSAAKKQDWEAVTTQLKGRTDVDQAQADGTTALSWAVYWDNLEVVNQLIKARANVNAGNDIGMTPLMLAVRNRNPEMVAVLLKAKADPDKEMWTGETPLMTAARLGQTAIAKMLIDAGANVNTSEPRKNQTALMWAISYRNPDIAKLLIEAGANVNVHTTKLKEDKSYSPMILEGYAGNVTSVSQGGYTPLMFAARANDLETAKLLINHGANVNDVSVEDGTALVIAASWGNEDLAIFLLGEGADPNIPDANNMTALHYAMRDGLKLLHGYEIVASTRVCGFAGDSLCKPIETLTEEEKAMMDEVAYGLYIVEGIVDTENADETADVILPGGNMYDLAEALLANGADVNAEMKYPPPRLRMDALPWLNLEGATPFMLASASLDNTGMEILLEHGANPLVKTDVHTPYFERQQEAYADDNQILGNGSSLLVAAGLGKKNDFTPQEERNAINVIGRLLELGGDVNEATATGWTAMHAAAFIGADNLVKFLAEKGAEINIQNGCGRTPLSLAEGRSVVGLLNRTLPRPTTVNVLLSLGADESKTIGPRGTCILGRGGLEVDIEIDAEVEAIRKQQELERQHQQQ